MTAGNTVRTAAAHSFSGKRIISGYQHDSEPVCHHIGLFLRRKQHHQRYAGRTAGRILKPVTVFRLIFLLFHPSTKLILCQKRQFGQIIPCTDIFRSDTGFIKPFFVKWNLVCFFYQPADSFILHGYNFLLIVGYLFLHSGQIQKDKYIYQFSLQLIKHVSPPYKTVFNVSWQF